MAERGATEADVLATVAQGERFPARFGRSGFRRNFASGGEWRGRRFSVKQIEVYAAEQETGTWLVITVIVRYY
jgi:hypothetical protein